MGNLTTIALVGFLFIHLAEIFSLVSISTPHWLASNVTEANSSAAAYTKGLWELCTHGNCSQLNQTAQATWFRATQALDVIGAGLGALALILTYFFLLATSCRNSTGMTSVSAALQCLASASLLAVVILFGTQGVSDVIEAEFPTGVATKFAWSYYVGIAGLVTMFVAAIATVREARYVANRRSGYENI